MKQQHALIVINQKLNNFTQYYKQLGVDYEIV